MTQSPTVFWAAHFALVLCPYLLKATLFKRVDNSSRRLQLFALGIFCLIPITWLISPDWQSKHVSRQALLIGEPIAFLTIPTISFLMDHHRNKRNMENWRVRVPFEILVAVPLWVVFWLWFELLVLGWVWI